MRILKKINIQAGETLFFQDVVLLFGVSEYFYGVCAALCYKNWTLYICM